MKSKMDWVKGWVRKWTECRFCYRNLYKGEMVWCLSGTPSPYFICKECGSKFKMGKVRIQWEKQRKEELMSKESRQQ